MNGLNELDQCMFFFFSFLLFKLGGIMQLCDPLCLRGHIFTCLPKVAMARLAAGMAAGSEYRVLCVTIILNAVNLCMFLSVLSIGGDTCCRVHVGGLQTRPYRDGSG